MTSNEKGCLTLVFFAILSKNEPKLTGRLGLAWGGGGGEEPAHSFDSSRSITDNSMTKTFDLETEKLPS